MIFAPKVSNTKFVMAAFLALIWTVAPSGGLQARDSLPEILAGIQKRYAGPGFAADFFQHSTLKAMDISDSAEGRIWVKRPAKMRWEYHKPEKQIVVTDGKRLWIYRPLDRQVMVGQAPDMFGQGKGAAFLSKMGQLRRNFDVTLVPSANPDYWRIKLVPLSSGAEMSEILVSVSRKNFCAEQIVTHNTYGDETRIVIRNYDFDTSLPDRLFEFEPPKGVEIIRIKP